MAAAKKNQPIQVSEQFSVALFNEEVELIRGIAKSLDKQHVPIFKGDGSVNKQMLVREAVRMAAEAIGTETGDTKLVALARSLQGAFRTPRLPGGDQTWRSR